MVESNMVIMRGQEPLERKGVNWICNFGCKYLTDQTKNLQDE